MNMALQLLKRNYTMEGQNYERPKILKLPQGEVRWAPRRLPVDVGDVIMNMRMDDGKNRYIGEHISKYSQGLNPYGEWGYPYKINKQFRPPIVDPKFYEPLSRMPVKFDAISSGPIVKGLYEKKLEISKVAPNTIISKICPSIQPRGCIPQKGKYESGNIDLHLKQPHASIPYHPSLPVHLNTGVPEIELDPKIIARPNMSIHAPYNISDQSRDIGNMRTPMHIAQQTNIKMPVPSPTIDTYSRDGYDLTPKVQTSAWYNPSYNLVELTDRQCNGDAKASVRDYTLITPAQTNISSCLTKNGALGDVSLRENLHVGDFQGKAQVPTIQNHQEYGRTREGRQLEYFFVQDGAQTMNEYTQGQAQTQVQNVRLRSRMNLQNNSFDRNITALEPLERTIPINANRFILPTVETAF